LSKLPSVELEASPRTLWRREIPGSGGSIDFQLSLSGAVTARFAEEPESEGGVDRPDDGRGAHGRGENEVEVPEQEVPRKPETETVSAELSVTYKEPTTLILSATFPISRSFQSTLGTCEVEGSPTFELDVTVKPEVAAKPARVPSNAAEFLAAYGHLFDSVHEGLVTFRSDRGKRSRLTFVAALLLALIGWSLAVWSLSAHGKNTAAPTSLSGTSAPVLVTNLSGALPGIGTVLTCTQYRDQQQAVFSTLPGAAFSVQPSPSVQECIIAVSSTGGADLRVTGVAPGVDAFVVDNTCTNPLSQGQTCLIFVDRPWPVAIRDDTVTIHQNLPGAPTFVVIPSVSTTTTAPTTTATTSSPTTPPIP
jgi:hypothetical protein